MKKIVGVGLLAGIFMIMVSLLLSPLFGFFFPSVQQEYQNASLFRPWSDPVMSLMFVHPLVLGPILAWLWDKTHHLIEEKDKLKKAITFTLIYSLLFLPGMLISYSTFPISFLMILTWVAMMFVQVLIASFVYVRMLRA